MINIGQNNIDLLRRYAEQYETEDFLVGDPSYFMHQVQGKENKEVTAFIASALSYGNRKQFMPKIQYLLDIAGGDMYGYIISGEYNRYFSASNEVSFYRLYSNAQFFSFLESCRSLLVRYGSVGEFLRARVATGYEAVEALTSFFAKEGSGGVIPKDTQSCCKRVCMYLRWMVRENSPVDLGLWADFIDKRTLIMPMDTHVLQQSLRLGLISSKTASMSAAVKLTATLAQVFPDDPLKGDFALFGYGVNNK